MALIQAVILEVNGKDYHFWGTPIAEEDRIVGEAGEPGASITNIRITVPFEALDEFAEPEDWALGGTD